MNTWSLLISGLTERYRLKSVSIGSMGWIDGQLVCLGELNKKLFLQVRLPRPSAFQLNSFKMSLQPLGLHKKLIVEKGVLIFPDLAAKILTNDLPEVLRLVTAINGRLESSQDRQPFLVNGMLDYLSPIEVQEKKAQLERENSEWAQHPIPYARASALALLASIPGALLWAATAVFIGRVYTSLAFLMGLFCYRAYIHIAKKIDWLGKSLVLLISFFAVFLGNVIYAAYALYLESGKVQFLPAFQKYLDSLLAHPKAEAPSYLVAALALILLARSIHKSSFSVLIEEGSEPKTFCMETVKLQTRHDRISVGLFFATIPLGTVPMIWGFQPQFGDLLDVNRWLFLSLVFYLPLVGLSYWIVCANDRYCAKHGLQRVGPMMNGILTIFQPMFLFFGIFGGIIGVNSSFDTSPEKPYLMMVMERFPESETSSSGRCYHLQTNPDAQDRPGEKVCESELNGVGSGAIVVRKARQGFLYIPWLQPGIELHHE